MPFGDTSVRLMSAVRQALDEGALFQGRHGGFRGFALAIAVALVIGKEECLIFVNRSAEGSAELILLQRLDG